MNSVNHHATQHQYSRLPSRFWYIFGERNLYSEFLNIINLMKRTMLLITSSVFLLGIFFSIKLSQTLLFPIVEKLIGHYPGDRVMGLFRLAGLVLILCSILLLISYLLKKERQEKLQKGLDKVNERIHHWLESKLGNWITFSEIQQKSLKFNPVDILIIAFFMIFSIAFFLVILQKDFPFVKLTSDGAIYVYNQINSSHPQYFAKDPFLSVNNNFSFLLSIVLLVVEWIQPFVGNYSFSLKILLIPTIFIFLLGYYLLGRKLTRNRMWGLYTAIIFSIPLTIPLENLGLFTEPLPRSVFSALLPYALLMAWSWKDQPKRWIFPTVFIGLMVYVHPLSAPFWMIAFLLGYLVFLPRDWNFRKKVLTMALQGFVLVILVAPYAIVFINSRRLGTAVNFDLIMQIFKHFMSPWYMNASSVYKEFIATMTSLALFPLACLGLVISWITKHYSRIRLFLSWGLGIFLLSFLFPFTERIFEQVFHLSPIEIELVRGYKFLALIFICCTIFLFYELTLRLKTIFLRALPVLLSLLVLILVFNGRTKDTLNFQPLIDCVKTDKLICGSVSQLDEVLLIIRDKIPQSSGIFFSRDAYDTDALAVRYNGLHSLMYSWKDKAFIYSRPDLLDEWFTTYERLVEEGGTTDWYLRNPEGFMEFARGLGSDYVVLEKPPSFKILDISPNAVVFQNDSYVLFKVDINTPSTH